MQHKLTQKVGLALLGLLAAIVVYGARTTPSLRLSAQATSAGAKTTSQSIPANTKSAWIGFIFGASSNNLAPTSVSLDSQTATKKVSIEVAGTLNLALYEAENFSTGASKTLAYTIPTGGYSTLDIAVDFRDTKFNFGASDADNCNACNALSTISLTNSNGDEIICVVGNNGGASITDAGGQTKLDEVSGASDYQFSSKTGTGTSTTLSWTFSGGLQGYACQVGTPIANTGGASAALGGAIKGIATRGAL